MKKILGLLMMTMLTVFPVLADDHAMVQPAADDVHLGTLYVVNNVVEVKDGHSTAHCACGANFDVTEKSAHVAIDGGTYYLCSEQCASTVAAMDETAKKSAIGSLQKALMTESHMQSNISTKDGKKMATCACGTEFEFGASTPILMENGMRMCACCDGCAKHVKAAEPAQRAAMMQKVAVTK